MGGGAHRKVRSRNPVPPQQFVDTFNASAPYYNTADLQLLGRWADAVGAVILGDSRAIARVEAVFRHPLAIRHAVDLFAKTLLSFAGKPRLASALRRVYERAMRQFEAGSDTHTLVHLLYTRVTRVGTLVFTPDVLHERLRRAQLQLA